ncbi:hypothetical protein PAPHI01_0409 [Pancytospora philotis]|nr:hypothetical protein PAPHI01_0409 [Pancytospora philotis]
MEPRINDRVTLKDGVSGVIHYLGPVDEKEGYWAGVELNQPLGSNDGAYKGKSYFKCRPGHGVFIRFQRLEAVDSEAAGKGDNAQHYQVRDKETLPGAMVDSRELEGLRSAMSFMENLGSVRDAGTGPLAAPSQLPLHGGEHPAHSYDSNQSLFFNDDYYCTPLSAAACSEQPRESSFLHPRCESRGTGGFADENDSLARQLEKYKCAFYRLLGTSTSAVEKIKTELDAVQARLDAIRCRRAVPHEREMVTGLIAEMYHENTRGNAARVGSLFEVFKGIMAKHRINVE